MVLRCTIVFAFAYREWRRWRQRREERASADRRASARAFPFPRRPLGMNGLQGVGASRNVRPGTSLITFSTLFFSSLLGLVDASTQATMLATPGNRTPERRWLYPSFLVSPWTWARRPVKSLLATVASSETQVVKVRWCRRHQHYLNGLQCVSSVVRRLR